MYIFYYIYFFNMLCISSCIIFERVVDPYLWPAFLRQKVMRHVVRQDVLQELHIVMPRLDHVAQLPLGLLLPQEVQTRRHLHQSAVVRHHHEEYRQEGQHLRRQRYRRSEGRTIETDKLIDPLERRASLSFGVRSIFSPFFLS